MQVHWIQNSPYRFLFTCTPRLQSCAEILKLLSCDKRHNPIDCPALQWAIPTTCRGTDFIIPSPQDSKLEETQLLFILYPLRHNYLTEPLGYNERHLQGVWWLNGIAQCTLQGLHHSCKQSKVACLCNTQPEVWIVQAVYYRTQLLQLVVE